MYEYARRNHWKEKDQNGDSFLGLVLSRLGWHSTPTTGFCPMFARYMIRDVSFWCLVWRPSAEMEGVGPKYVHRVHEITGVHQTMEDTEDGLWGIQQSANSSTRPVPAQGQPAL